jgi:DNA-binding MarR family transcriptional regulator
MEVSRRAMVPRDVDFDFGTHDAVVMARLVEQPEGATITRLTELTGIAQSQVSTAVAHLRALGWVSTAPDPADRRRTVARIVPEVRRGIDRVGAAPARAALDELLGVLASGERERVAEALELLSRRRAEAASRKRDGARARAGRA